MSAQREIPQLAALKEALDSRADSDGSLEQAAPIVSSFTDEETISALDNILALTVETEEADVAVQARETSDEFVQQAGLLLEEVSRFLSPMDGAAKEG